MKTETISEYCKPSSCSPRQISWAVDPGCAPKTSLIFHWQYLQPKLHSLPSHFLLCLGYLPPVIPLTVFEGASFRDEVFLWLWAPTGKETHTCDSHGIIFTSGSSYSSFTCGERLWWHLWVTTPGDLSQLDMVQYSKGNFGSGEQGGDERGKSEQGAVYCFGSPASWSAWLPCCLLSQPRQILNWGRYEISNIYGTFSYSSSGWLHFKDITSSSWGCSA